MQHFVVFFGRRVGISLTTPPPVYSTASETKLTVRGYVNRFVYTTTIEWVRHDFLYAPYVHYVIDKRARTKYSTLFLVRAEKLDGVELV